MTLMHKVQVAPLIGLPQFNGWSQVVVNDHQNVMVAIAVSGQNAGNIGRDLVSQIKETTVTSVENFYDLLQHLNLDTQELGVELAVSAAYLTDEAISYATLRGAIILKRGEKVGKLVSSENELRLIQGKPHVEDLVVLTTQAAASFLGEIQQKAIQGYSPDVIIKSLAPAIHKQPETATLSIGFVTFAPAEVEVPEAELPVELPAVTESATVEFIEPDLAQPMVSPEEIPSIHEISLFEVQSPTPQWSGETEPVRESFSVTPVAEPAPTVTLFSITTPTIKTEPLPPKPSLGEQLQPIIKKSLSLLNTLRVQGKRVATSVGKHLGPVASKIGSKLKNKISKTKADGWSAPQLNLASSSSVYVISGHTIARRRVLLVVVIIILLVLAGFGFWKHQQSQQVSAAQAQVGPLITKLLAAKNQVDADPVAARTQMQAVINEFEQVKQHFTGQPAAEKVVADTLAQAQTIYQEVSGKQELQELPIFFDLATVSPGFLASRVTGTSTQAFLMDQEKQAAILLDITNKTPRQISLAAIPSFKDVTFADTNLLFLSDGVKQLDLTQPDAALSEVIAKGDSNQDATLLGTYGNYIYLLNPSKRNIFRYLRSADKVSEPIGWMKTGNPIPYDDITTMRIDGDMWLGTKTGQVIKLTSGENQNFAMTGLSEALTGPILLDTREDDANIYVLEPSSRRLMVISKAGQVLKEIKSTSLAAATGLVVSEAQHKALILNGSLVFEVDL